MTLSAWLVQWAVRPLVPRLFRRTSGRGVGPVPYNYGQGYAPKTAVWTLEETHTFNSNLLNQIKWGYARYNGPTFNPDYSKTYAASTMGITFGNAPAGQAANAFPIVTFSGTDAPPVEWHHGRRYYRPELHGAG